MGNAQGRGKTALSRFSHPLPLSQYLRAALPRNSLVLPCRGSYGEEGELCPPGLLRSRAEPFHLHRPRPPRHRSSTIGRLAEQSRL